MKLPLSTVEIKNAEIEHLGAPRNMRESLKQFDDDIDILKTYLKTQRAPKAVIEALEDLAADEHKSLEGRHREDRESAGE